MILFEHGVRSDLEGAVADFVYVHGIMKYEVMRFNWIFLN